MYFVLQSCFYIKSRTSNFVSKNLIIDSINDLIRQQWMHDLAFVLFIRIDKSFLVKQQD